MTQMGPAERLLIWIMIWIVWTIISAMCTIITESQGKMWGIFFGANFVVLALMFNKLFGLIAS